MTKTPIFINIQRAIIRCGCLVEKVVVSPMSVVDLRAELRRPGTPLADDDPELPAAFKVKVSRVSCQIKDIPLEQDQELRHYVIRLILTNGTEVDLNQFGEEIQAPEQSAD